MQKFSSEYYFTKSKRVSISVPPQNEVTGSSLGMVSHSFSPKYRMRFLFPNKLPRRPGTMTCPNCLSAIIPFQTYRITRHTHYLAAILAPLLLFWLPYVTGCCKEAIHHCPLCRVTLGNTEFRLCGKKLGVKSSKATRSS